jgi:Uncharacterized protein conserved in bacteria
MPSNSETFFSASPEELAMGYKREPGGFVCLSCGAKAELGRIYRRGEDFFEPERFIREHIAGEHGSMLELLLGLDRRLTGLSEREAELMRRFARGEDDKTIAGDLGIAASTVRNHRFAMREKAKQARIFLAASSLMEAGQSKDDQFIQIRRSATMVDERYAVTESERDEILGKFFEGRKLKEFPTRQKRKLVILDEIAKDFEAGRRYSEKEVNELILERFGDYATIRRYLIEYGYLDREPGGAAYWVKES